MKKFLLACSSLIICSAAFAQSRAAFHNECADTTRINEMLIAAAAAKPASVGDAVVMLGSNFLDTPYKGGTLEGPTEELRINIDSVDCTTFVETVMALAMTVEQKRSSWLDFIYNLQKLRYRGGVINGYPSRLHYISDWAVDNSHRGNLKDVTTQFPKYTYVVKTIDFMSANAGKYPALADSANLAGILNTEIGYRSHRYPIIKTVDLDNKAVKAAFRNGDILAFATNIKNLDISHMGILVMKDGVPHVMHASSSAGKVVLTERPIYEFLKKNRSMTGVRVFRLTE